MAHLEISDIRSYEQIDRFLNGRLQKKIGYHTVARRENGEIIVRQWNTDIYRITPDNVATLDVDTWFTVTTKDRLNQLLPGSVRIYSEKGRWFLFHNVPNWLDKVPFTNGIRINVETREIVANPGAKKITAQDKHNERIKKLIRSYLDGLTEEKFNQILKDAKENGTAGDCFYCQFHTTDTYEPIGDAFQDHGHLLEHLKEKYYMVSLFYNAEKSAGAAHPEFRMTLLWALKRDLRRYFSKRLLEGIATI